MTLRCDVCDEISESPVGWVQVRPLNLEGEPATQYLMCSAPCLADWAGGAV